MPDNDSTVATEDAVGRSVVLAGTSGVSVAAGLIYFGWALRDHQDVLLVFVPIFFAMAGIAALGALRLLLGKSW